MVVTSQSRVPSGVPSGGRFAPSTHAEVDIDLADVCAYSDEVWIGRAGSVDLVDEFERRHAGDFLSSSWSRVTRDGAPAIQVVAHLGGDRAGRPSMFLVSPEEFEARHENPGGVFVIDPARHRRIG